MIRKRYEAPQVHASGILALAESANLSSIALAKEEAFRDSEKLIAKRSAHSSRNLHTWFSATADKVFKVERGFNLIEIVVFIIVMAIIGVVILSTFSRALKGTGIITPETIATKAATTCMEYFLGQRIAKGYTAAALNCSGFTTPSFCTDLSATATCQNDISASGTCQGNCKIITVTATGTGKAQATLSMLIANY